MRPRGGRQVVVGWPSSGLRVRKGWAPLAAGWFQEGAAGRGMGAAGRGARPRDGGPGQGHTAPGADSLAGAAPRPGAESAPRSRRAPRPQFPRCRAGPGGGVVKPSGRWAGRGYLWKETERFSPLPCRLEQFAAAQQITISGLGPPRRHQAPALASSRRARSGTAPRGGARRHGCGTWEPAPAAPYGKMAAPTSPPPAVGTPRVSGTQSLKHPEWLCPRFEALGVSRGTRAGGPYSDMARRPVRTARWPRLRVRAHGGLSSSPRGLFAHLRQLPPPRWVVAGLHGEHAEGRRGAERTSRNLRA